MERMTAAGTATAAPGLLPTPARAFTAPSLPKDRRPARHGVVGNAPPAAFPPRSPNTTRSPYRTAELLQTA